LILNIGPKYLKAGSEIKKYILGKCVNKIIHAIKRSNHNKNKKKKKPAIRNQSKLTNKKDK
jgi:hypothetical protein